jgi:DNA-binding NarL/FixJ family response regulator
VVGEDEPLFQAGLLHILGEAGVTVVAVAENAQDLLREVRTHQPDLALVDLRMPPGSSDDGLRAAREIHSGVPAIPVLILSQFIEDEFAVDFLADERGGVGYLLKDGITDAATFVAMVRQVAAGASVIDPAVLAWMIARQRRRDALDELTPRERDVLTLMADGMSNHGIAESLVVTDSAVERHITGIFAKLGLAAEMNSHRRVLAVLRFLKR